MEKLVKAKELCNEAVGKYSLAGLFIGSVVAGFLFFWLGIAVGSEGNNHLTSVIGAGIFLGVFTSACYGGVMGHEQKIIYGVFAFVSSCIGVCIASGFGVVVLGKNEISILTGVLTSVGTGVGLIILAVIGIGIVKSIQWCLNKLHLDSLLNK
ncbi:MAG: hypothetical protein AABW67_03865 [Nanoarchaeota archaeon]